MARKIKKMGVSGLVNHVWSKTRNHSRSLDINHPSGSGMGNIMHLSKHTTKGRANRKLLARSVKSSRKFLSSTGQSPRRFITNN